MKTRTLYYALRSQYRLARRDLLKSDTAFTACVGLNSLLRDLTGKWDTGVGKPEPWGAYRKRSKDRWCLFVSLSLTKWLKANA